MARLGRLSRFALAAVSLLFASGSTSCCLVPGDTCTLIGCDDGLRVTVVSDSISDVAVEVIGHDDEQRRRRCDSLPCFVFFDGFHPRTVTVRVIDGAGAITVEPDYQTQRPNGRCCPPSCRSAHVDVVL